MSSTSAGTGYFIAPDAGPGLPLLLLCSWWGLTPGAKATAEELADLGYSVLAPDLTAGELPVNHEQAAAALASMDVNTIASLVQSSLGIVVKASSTPSGPARVVGYGSGASWALWLSKGAADAVSHVATFCGSQNIDMDGATARYLCHFAAEDDLVDDLDVAELGLSLSSAELDFQIEHHHDTVGGFADRGDPAHDPLAEAVAWRQTIEFLAS